MEEIVGREFNKRDIEIVGQTFENSAADIASRSVDVVDLCLNLIYLKVYD